MAPSGYYSSTSASTWGMADCYEWDGTASNATTWNTDTACVKYILKKSLLESTERVPQKIPAGKRRIELPDGAILQIDDAGNYVIDDSGAKVVYRSNRIREFSPHINASDMVSDFIRYVGGLGVRRDDVMGLPIHLFISWLIIEAAERDGDLIDIPRLEDAREIKELKHPQCLACGRYIRQRNAKLRFPYCNPQHAAQHLAIAG